MGSDIDEMSPSFVIPAYSLRKSFDRFNFVLRASKSLEQKTAV